MAHEISFTSDGIAECAFAMKPAWHGLGTVLDHVPDSETMIHAAHLDWYVRKVPLRTVDGVDVPKHFATVREDSGEVLGVVGDWYKIVQNRDAFTFLDSLVAEGGLRYEAAGALKGGRRVWALARMPSVDEIAPDDHSFRYVLFSTCHDGTGALHAIPTSVRVVCANTLRVATATSVGIRHTGDVKGKLNYARKLLSQFDEKFALFRDQGRLLAGKKITSEQTSAYIRELFPDAPADQTRSVNAVRKIRAAIMDNLYNRRQTMPSIRGTWWAAVNAVTEYYDHENNGKTYDAQETRFASRMDGTDADRKAKAFALALQMAS